MAQHSLVEHGLWGQEAGWTASTPVGIPASLPRGLSWGLSEHLLQGLAAGLSYRRTGQDQGRHAARSMDPTILFQSQGSWPSSQLGSSSEKTDNSPKVSWSWTRTLTPGCAPNGRLALVKAEVGSVKRFGGSGPYVTLRLHLSAPFRYNTLEKWLRNSPERKVLPGFPTRLATEKGNPHYLDRKGWAESATCRRLVSPPTRVLPAIPTNRLAPPAGASTSPPLPTQRLLLASQVSAQTCPLHRALRLGLPSFCPVSFCNNKCPYIPHCHATTTHLSTVRLPSQSGSSVRAGRDLNSATRAGLPLDEYLLNSLHTMWYIFFQYLY